MKRMILIGMAILILLILAGIAALYWPVVLERDRLQTFNVKQIEMGEGRALRIEGITLDSALVVVGVETVNSEGVVEVRIKKQFGMPEPFRNLFQKNATAVSFGYTIPIPEGTASVVFGNRKETIWTDVASNDN